MANLGYRQILHKIANHNYPQVFHKAANDNYRRYSQILHKMTDHDYRHYRQVLYKAADHSYRKIPQKIAIHIQTMFGAGLLVTLPIGVTVLVLKFFFDLLDPLFQPFLRYLPGPNIPGLGVITLIVLVYIAGLVTTHVVGRRLIDIGHQVMERIPVVKSIYSTTRSGVEILAGSKDQPYRGVVLVEFPRPGMLSIGLITAQLGTMNGEEMVAVYIPTTPLPSNGFLVVVPAKEVITTELSVDDAMKMVITGGIMAKDLFVSSAPQNGASEGQTQTAPEKID